VISLELSYITRVVEVVVYTAVLVVLEDWGVGVVKIRPVEQIQEVVVGPGGVGMGVV
tara:strand:- start:96 stop:266 length:171 start_codon:yes stop_codon:yes gene_type:complete